MLNIREDKSFTNSTNQTPSVSTMDTKPTLVLFLHPQSQSMATFGVKEVGNFTQSCQEKEAATTEVLPEEEVEGEEAEEEE